MRRILATAGTALLLSLPGVGAQGGTASHLLVIAGLSGDEENAARFHEWAARLVDAARQQHGLAAESVVYLGEDPARDPVRINGRSTREGIEAAAARLAARARPGDLVFIVLIGHGGSSRGETRFNLPGPDLGAAEFAALVGRFGAQRVAFVNTASASGGFAAALAGRDRVIVTATKTDAERNQTRFAGYFVDAIAGADGDLDKDGRVSLLEAFSYTRQQVAQSYEKDGQLLTEHALLEDDGDGKGSETPGQPGADGVLARTFVLGGGVESGGAAIVTDPALKALYEERRAIEDRIAALRTARGRTDPAHYAQEMEALLIELARKTREIREREKK
jgi:hypothetical protein